MKIEKKDKTKQLLNSLTPGQLLRITQLVELQEQQPDLIDYQKALNKILQERG